MLIYGINHGFTPGILPPLVQPVSGHNPPPPPPSYIPPSQPPPCSRKPSTLPLSPTLRYLSILLYPVSIYPLPVSIYLSRVNIYLSIRMLRNTWLRRLSDVQLSSDHGPANTEKSKPENLVITDFSSEYLVIFYLKLM